MDLKVDTARVSDDAARIGELMGQIPQILDEIRAARTTLSASWEGVAHDSYNNTMIGYENQLHRIYEIMTVFAENMDTSATKYHRTEQDVLAEVKSFI